MCACWGRGLRLPRSSASPSASHLSLPLRLFLLLAGAAGLLLDVVEGLHEGAQGLHVDRELVGGGGFGGGGDRERRDAGSSGGWLLLAPEGQP